MRLSDRGPDRIFPPGRGTWRAQDTRGIKGEGGIKLTDNTTQIAKNLRKTCTIAERLLWGHLRAKQVEGYKFRRQEPIGNYVVDFVCFEKRIIIEVDGSQHQIEKDKDSKRDKWFKEQGFRVLRFWNNEVLRNLEGVLELIRESCLDHPTPSHQGRGKTNNRHLCHGRDARDEHKTSPP
jgi:very-short-patch-repair endonuclease